MSISTTTNEAQYNCDGTQTEFSLAVKVFEEDDIVVYILNTDTSEQTTLTNGTDYTVEEVSDDYDNGALITTTETYSSDYTITLSREIDNTQELSLTEGGDLPSAGIEDALDRTVMQVQQLQSTVDGCIQKPETDPSDLDYTLPSASDRASQMLGFDEDGNVTTYGYEDLVDVDPGVSVIYGSSGTTDERPTLTEGNAFKYIYMDTDLGYPIFWNGADWSNFAGISGL